MKTEAELAKLALEGRTIVRRMIEDWPYQPPEVVAPERFAFKAWADNDDAFSDLHLLALKKETE